MTGKQRQKKNKRLDRRKSVIILCFFVHFRFSTEKMRLFLLLTLVFIPLVYSSPISLGEEFNLPSLENLESHIDKLWGNFKKGYGFIYNTTTEEIHRFKIFAQHVKLIIQHNIEHDLGLHTYRLGVNKFATLVKHKIESLKLNFSYYFDRQTKNFVDNSMVIKIKNVNVHNILAFVNNRLRLHPLSLYPCQLIGVIKVLSHQSKIKVNAARVGHSVAYVELNSKVDEFFFLRLCD